MDKMIDLGLGPFVMLLIGGVAILLVGLFYFREENRGLAGRSRYTGLFIMGGLVLLGFAIYGLILYYPDVLIYIVIFLVIIAILNFVVLPKIRKSKNEQNRNLYENLIGPLEFEVKSLLRQGKYQEAANYLEAHKETFFEFSNEGLAKYLHKKKKKKLIECSKNLYRN
jgi:4-amino-4-deoxy-L-arabinose transferase-like glycosyltransferase